MFWKHFWAGPGRLSALGGRTVFRRFRTIFRTLCFRARRGRAGRESCGNTCGKRGSQKNAVAGFGPELRALSGRGAFFRKNAPRIFFKISGSGLAKRGLSHLRDCGPDILVSGYGRNPGPRNSVKVFPNLICAGARFRYRFFAGRTFPALTFWGRFPKLPPWPSGPGPGRPRFWPRKILPRAPSFGRFIHSNLRDSHT